MEMPLQITIVTRLHMRIEMVILMVTMEMMLMDGVLQILPTLMIMVKAMMLESLNNRDYNGYEHIKQFVLSTKQWHCTCITLFGTFLWRSQHDPNVNLPVATFYRGRDHTSTNSRFSFTLGSVLKNSAPGKFANICQLTQLNERKRVWKTALNSFSSVTLLLRWSWLLLLNLP